MALNAKLRVLVRGSKPALPGPISCSSSETSWRTGSISDTARGVKSTNRPRGTSSWSPKGFVQGFTGARCGTGAWQIGATQDISNTGCFTFKPLSQCGADYDVARVDADHFSNGARDADLCTPAGRPTRLADFSFNRVKA